MAALFLFLRVGRIPPLGLLYAYGYNNALSNFLANKEPMNLQTTLTNIPKVELRKTRIWRTFSRIGKFLRVVLVILVLVGLMISYILLSFITPAGG
jgi:hypothetical protein